MLTPIRCWRTSVRCVYHARSALLRLCFGCDWLSNLHALTRTTTEGNVTNVLFVAGFSACLLVVGTIFGVVGCLLIAGFVWRMVRSSYVGGGSVGRTSTHACTHACTHTRMVTGHSNKSVFLPLSHRDRNSRNKKNYARSSTF